MRHRVFRNIYDQVFEDPVRLLAVQPHNELVLRQFPAEVKISLFNLAVIFQSYLLDKIYDIYFHIVHDNALARRLADLKEVFDQHFKPQRLFLQHFDIFFPFLLVFLIFQKIRISDDRGKRRAQVMGYIRHKLCLHPLILHFLVHGFLEPFLDLLQFILDRIEQPDIPLDGNVQMPVGELVRRSEEQLIFLLKVFHIFSQEEEQKHGVNDKRKCSVIPQEAHDRQYDIVDDHDLKDRPVRLLAEIQMLECIVLFCEESFHPLDDAPCLSHHLFIALGASATVMPDQLHGQRAIAPVCAFHAEYGS